MELEWERPDSFFRILRKYLEKTILNIEQRRRDAVSSSSKRATVPRTSSSSSTTSSPQSDMIKRFKASEEYSRKVHNPRSDRIRSPRFLAGLN
ncbi:Hypothetical protein FKW44_008566, partial [Caligus rogercresseyi]